MKQRVDTNFHRINRHTATDTGRPAATDTQRQSRDLLKFIYRLNSFASLFVPVYQSTLTFLVVTFYFIFKYVILCLFVYFTSYHVCILLAFGDNVLALLAISYVLLFCQLFVY